MCTVIIGKRIEKITFLFDFQVFAAVVTFNCEFL